MGLEIGTTLLLAGLAASGAGTGLQMSAASAEQEAMGKAVEAELQRQQGFQKKGQEALAESISKQSPANFQKNQQDATDAAKQEYAKLQSTPLMQPPVGSGGGGNNPTENSIVGQQAQARTQMSNELAAPVRGLSDAQVQSWLNNLKSSSDINQIDTFARQSESVLPTEIQAAKNSESGMAGFGSLLGTAGSLLSMGAALGAFAPSAAISAAPSQAAMTGLESGLGPISNTTAAGLAAGGGSPILGVFGAPTFGKLATTAPNFFAPPTFY